MKLIDALKLIKTSDPPGEDARRGFLACGFTTLHLETFLKAHLIARHGTAVEMGTGVFDDLAGNVRRLATEPFDFGFMVIEWADLDPRLGIRTTSRYRDELLCDIEATVNQRLEQLQVIVSEAAAQGSLRVSLPTLPLPSRVPVRSPQGDEMFFALQATLCQFALAISELKNVRVLSPKYVDERFLHGDRHNIREDLRSGFPYKLPFCSELARQLVDLSFPPLPKKGLITDLDNTFWRGVVGDDGVDGVSWNLDHNSQQHALYQQFLGALAANGILLAVASKNSKDIALQAMSRDDTLVPADAFFPLEIHWEPKSQSIGRILHAWNIGPGDVVFVDDSSLEISEVASAWPEATCLEFPATDEQRVISLIERLGDLFAKEQVGEEDRIRAQTIRANVDFQEHRKHDPEQLLKGLEANISLQVNQPDQRCFDLINKTNQFNLNGRRITQPDWDRYVERKDTFVVAAKYEDRFGLLGNVAVIAGTTQGESNATIDFWVMSCRAFSRRIEFQLLQSVFAAFDLSSVELDYEPTERNGPLQQFLHDVLHGTVNKPVRISVDGLLSNSPILYGKVTKL